MKIISTFAVAIAIAAHCSVSVAKEIKTSKAERVGMSSERLARITKSNQHFVDSGQVAGMITLVNRKGKIVHRDILGSRGVNDKRPLQEDDIFRLFSMTKPVIAVAAMQLYEQGKFQLRDPVSKYVPELAGVKVLKKNGELHPLVQPMTIQHLLTHTAGLSHGIYPNDPVDQRYIEAKIYQSRDLDELMAKLGTLPLKYQPGTQWHYSASMDVVGAIIERVSGQRLDVYLDENIFKPLNMNDTAFSVTEEKRQRFVPNHYVENGVLKTIEEQNGNGETDQIDSLGLANTISYDGCGAMCDFYNVTLFAGSGGLVATARDYMRFAEMLRNGGELDGVRILSPKTISYMSMNHLPALLRTETNQPVAFTGLSNNVGYGLGFGVVIDEPASGILSSKGTFFWTGASSTSFWIDPVEGIAVVSMMQRRDAWPINQTALQVGVMQALIDCNGCSKSNQK